MKRLLGTLLFLLGSLGAAFIASMSLESVEWSKFVIAIIVGAAGVYVIKSDLHAHARSNDVLQKNKANIHESLAAIVRNLEALNKDKGNIPTYEMRFEIDKKFRTDLIRFADARESIKHIYSINDFADIMSAFAAGERYLNRVWSASTDGYIDEVTEYLDRALHQFKEAQTTLERAGA